MQRPGLVSGFILAAALVFLTPPKASGAGIILITHGDTISHLGDVAPPLQAQVREFTKSHAAKIGFKYSYFGVFWLDLWTWGGEYCIYDGKTYWALPVAAAAHLMGKSEGDLSRPWNYKYPLGLLILGGVVAIGTIAVVREKRAARRTQALFDDPRYQKAVEIMTDPAAKESTSPGPEGQPPAPAGVEAAVQYLVAEGISPREAEKNLHQLLQLLQKKGLVPTGNPGEDLVGLTLTVRVEKAGDQPGQGVGHLPDGSLVLVEGGVVLVGQEVPIEVIKVESTPEGRMILGKVANLGA